MSRYYNIIFILCLCFFIGCSVKNEPNLSFKNVNLDEGKVLEDYLLMQALVDEYYDDDLNKVLDLYEKLYQQTNKYVYLSEAIRISFIVKNIERRNELLEHAIKKYPNNITIIHFWINKLLSDKKYNEAIKFLNKNIKIGKIDENYLLLASIYDTQKQYKNAIKYYEKAYKINKDEKVFLLIVDILYEDLNEKTNAIKKLQNYISFISSSKQAYFKLLYFYSKQNNFNGLISTYKKMYEIYKDESYSKKVIELYMYTKNTRDLIEFLVQNQIEAELLLDLYTQNKSYKKAYLLSKKLYEKYNDVEFLGNMAIFEYELHAKKITKKILKSVSKKFEQTLKISNSALFLNYYGYLLIDHNIDVKKGIELIKLALKQDEDSVYYIDSLAWGYYKLNECEKAYKIIKKIYDKSDIKEIKEHFEIIKKCTKGKK